MSKRTLDELRKEINGKQVVYVSKAFGVRFDAILLCPPDGKIATLKPYGYTPEEVFAAYREAGNNWAELDDIKAKEFCLSSFEVCEANRADLESVANLADSSELDFNEITGQSKVTSMLNSNPSCPYG